MKESKSSNMSSQFFIDLFDIMNAQSLDINNSFR